VFQDAALFEHLSVRRNLLYGRKRAGLGADGEFDRLVQVLGLEPLLERGPGKLSGGERQRVAIGRALLSEPRLLLMDEPLASVDAARKAEVLPYIEALRREAKAPVFYVTHDVTEAARVGDRILLMRDGRLADAAGQAAPSTGEWDERRWLRERLERLGADELAAELVLGGTPPMVARLAIEALRDGPGEPPGA